jgi:hypothetical protein
LQLFEGAVIVLLAEIDDPLEAEEFAGGGGEGVAGGAGGGFGVFCQERIGGVVPELGFDATQAAEAPLVVNESVDEEALVGIGGVVMLVIFGGEPGEVIDGFVEHNLGSGHDAVLGGVVAGCGFFRGRVRTGRFW